MNLSGCTSLISSITKISADVTVVALQQSQYTASPTLPMVALAGLRLRSPGIVNRTKKLAYFGLCEKKCEKQDFFSSLRQG